MKYLPTCMHAQLHMGSLRNHRSAVSRPSVVSTGPLAQACNAASQIGCSVAATRRGHRVMARHGTELIDTQHIDTSTGGVAVRTPRFRPNLNIQPMRKINYGLESVRNRVGNHLHPFLMIFEWPDAIFKMTPTKYQVPTPHLF